METGNQNGTDSIPRYAELIADLLNEVMDHLLSPDSLEKICGEPVTPSQFEVLQYIYRHGRRSPVTRLADGLNISRPAATKFVDRLEEHKWVKRRNDPDDARIYYAQLTDKGLHVVESIKRYRLQRIQTIVSRMNHDDQVAFFKGVEGFIHSSLEEDDLTTLVCLNCGSEAVRECQLYQRFGRCMDPSMNSPKTK